jgi:hypothetical protein
MSPPGSRFQWKWTPVPSDFSRTDDRFVVCSASAARTIRKHKDIYFTFFLADYVNFIGESDEGNNALAGNLVALGSGN